MSEGLYSMEAKDFDKTLDLTKIKPYGDTMNDDNLTSDVFLDVLVGFVHIHGVRFNLRNVNCAVVHGVSAASVAVEECKSRG